MFKGFHYTRHPTLELLVGATIFAAALVITTFVVTSRYENPNKTNPGAPGIWDLQITGTDSDLNDITFLNLQNGWAVGEKGTILYTSDGGENWTKQRSGTDLELASVDFRNVKEGWIVGKLGFIIHTTDGGETWGQQADPETTLGLNLTNVTFLDTKTGHVLTERGSAILKTVNGGKTWVRESLGNTSKRSDMFFVNSQRGWILFSSGGVFHTSDGGLTWRLRSGPNGAAVGQNGIYFIDENNGWIAGWRGRKSDVRAGLQFSQFLSDGMVARTTDGGQSWHRHDTRTGRFLWDLVFLDNQRGWAVGSFGSVIYTNDSGVTWTTQMAETDEILRSVVFADHNNGWAVGDNGTILKFTGR